MTARIHNRLTAAVACGLLFAVGSELPAEPPVAGAMRSVFESDESVNAETVRAVAEALINAGWRPQQ